MIDSENNLFEILIFSFFQISNKHIEDQVDNWAYNWVEIMYIFCTGS